MNLATYFLFNFWAENTIKRLWKPFLGTYTAKPQKSSLRGALRNPNYDFFTIQGIKLGSKKLLSYKSLLFQIFVDLGHHTQNFEIWNP
jgi:hypothetical protein